MHLEQFQSEIALADAGADVRRRGVSAASAVALRAYGRRQQSYLFALLRAEAGVLEALRMDILNAKMLYI